MVQFAQPVLVRDYWLLISVQPFEHSARVWQTDRQTDITVAIAGDEKFVVLLLLFHSDWFYLKQYVTPLRMSHWKRIDSHITSCRPSTVYSTIVAVVSCSITLWILVKGPEFPTRGHAPLAPRCRRRWIYTVPALLLMWRTRLGVGDVNGVDARQQRAPRRVLCRLPSCRQLGPSRG